MYARENKLNSCTRPIYSTYILDPYTQPIYSTYIPDLYTRPIYFGLADGPLVQVQVLTHVGEVDPVIKVDPVVEVDPVEVSKYD